MTNLTITIIDLVVIIANLVILNDLGTFDNIKEEIKRRMPHKKIQVMTEEEYNAMWREYRKNHR